MAGGATRMPAVRRMVAALAGVAPRETVNPEACVALGAAIQAGVLTGQVRWGQGQGCRVLRDSQPGGLLRAGRRHPGGRAHWPGALGLGVRGVGVKRRPTRRPAPRWAPLSQAGVLTDQVRWI